VFWSWIFACLQVHHILNHERLTHEFLPLKKLVILCMGVVWQFPWVQVVLVNVTWCNCHLFWLCVFSTPWGFEAQSGLNTLGCGVVWRERKIQVVLGTTVMRKEPDEEKTRGRVLTSITCAPPPPIFLSFNHSFFHIWMH
jgi:hypothetical protein